MYVCMYVCMKTNFVPVITLERMDRISRTFACILGINLELIKFWSWMNNFEVLFKKNNNFGKFLF